MTARRESALSLEQSPIGCLTFYRFLFGENILGGNSPSGEGGQTAPAIVGSMRKLQEKGSFG